MMAEHTPGPWVAELEEPFTLGGDFREVVALDEQGMVTKQICSFMLDTDAHPSGADFLQDIANAKLIAASPDLLAALENWLHYFERRIELETSDPLYQVTLSVHGERVTQTRAAIAKAKGNG